MRDINLNLKKYFDGKEMNWDTVSETEDILHSGLIDSFGIVELIGYLEDTFDISFDENDINEENFKTIGNIIELVTKKIQ
jgi:acyl carrier protein